MAKFTSLQDIGLKKVSSVIKRWMREVETNAPGEKPLTFVFVI